jgi:hypothetical protein
MALYQGWNDICWIFLFMRVVPKLPIPRPVGQNLFDDSEYFEVPDTFEGFFFFLNLTFVFLRREKKKK